MALDGTSVSTEAGVVAGVGAPEFQPDDVKALLSLLDPELAEPGRLSERLEYLRAVAPDVVAVTGDLVSFLLGPHVAEADNLEAVLDEIRNSKENINFGGVMPSAFAATNPDGTRGTKNFWRWLVEAEVPKQPPVNRYRLTDKQIGFLQAVASDPGMSIEKATKAIGIEYGHVGRAMMTAIRKKLGVEEQSEIGSNRVIQIVYSLGLITAPIEYRN